MWVHFIMFYTIPGTATHSTTKSCIIFFEQSGFTFYFEMDENGLFSMYYTAKMETYINGRECPDGFFVRRFSRSFVE